MLVPMLRHPALWLVLLGALWAGGAAAPAAGQAAEPFILAPAVAVEAEHFTVERGWSVTKMGEGNYAVDIIGFSHAGGERFLSADKADATASAFKDVQVPVAGPYRLWVRYEYMPFTDTRFKVVVEQGGRTVAEGIVGAHDNLRIAFEQQELTVAQYDPPWGNEGLVEELIEVPALDAGPARLRLLAVEQPQVPGRTANRHVDLLYLTRDTTDAWRQHYRIPYYRILDAFRDTYGPRYEVRFTNRSDAPLSIATAHIYNRHQFYQRPDAAAAVKDLPPGQSSDWLPMPMQDTTHFGMVEFTPSAAAPFTAAVRPIGGAEAEETVETPGEPARLYLPPYPGQGEQAIGVLKQLDAVLALLESTPAPGRVPTRPLAYGWTVPLWEDSQYSRKYAQLWAALGMRSYVSGIPTPMAKRHLEEAGVPPSRSVLAMEYRFPPTAANIAEAKAKLEAAGVTHLLRWFDYGDEIAFSEWVEYMAQEQRAAAGDPNLTTAEIVRPLWRQWLAERRGDVPAEQYWRGAWGPFDAAGLRPDSSADAAGENPRLYVDSVIFYEDAAIAWVARGSAAVKAAFGPEVLTGANYSGYPFYYPHTTPYIKWFRDGAGDFGRHSEYFWQLGQVTPMINGYFVEHFRAGMRFNPQALMKQYVMPHSPGNTDASFRRTAFSHLAHGVKNMDFFGIGMNETFTENYIDHRDHARYLALRDVTHSMALVEDVLEDSKVVPSPVALLVSESTERWDHAGIARDFAGHNYGPGFRQTRLTYHQDRVGIWKALTFAGAAPDLLVERDLIPDMLKDYRVLYLVGDSIPAEVVPAVEAWVRGGGVLFATAGVGRYGMYREPNPALEALLGLGSRRLEERDTFVRASQELPFLQPLGAVTLAGQRPGRFPALAIHERIEPAGEAKALAAFDDGAPAVIVRDVGRGKVYYAATLPGLAYLYTGLTNPIHVADRADAAHREINNYDPHAAALILRPLQDAAVQPALSFDQEYIDARLIAAEGCFFLPVANYHAQVGRPVTVTIRPPPGAAPPAEAIAAFNGPLAVQVKEGAWVLTIPKLGYGELVRINTR